MYLLLMGIAEVLFVMWHTFTLMFFVYCVRNAYHKLIHWLLRILHLGAVLLLLLMIAMCLEVWPKLPDLFQWTATTCYLFASIITKYVTLAYWASELMVDLCQCLCCSPRND